MDEKKLGFLFENSSDSIYITDLHGNIVEVNKTAITMLGFDKDQILRMNIRDITAYKFKQYIVDNIEFTIQKGTHIFESEIQTIKNNIYPVEIKSKLLDYDQMPVIINVARSIIERKEFEKKLINTIIQTEDKERKRFAADLHDGLSPILSTIKLYVDLLKKGEFQKTSKEEIIDNIEKLCDLSISTAKEIAVNITPSILHDFGLAVAVNEFCQYVNKTKSVSIHVDTENYTITERTILESVLYQATKELINNTLRHSGAKNITIELKNRNCQLILYYRDDGHGFDMTNTIENSPGYGLNNIINKIKTIKGSCDYYSIPGQGMAFIITVNLNQ